MLQKQLGLKQPSFLESDRAVVTPPPKLLVSTSHLFQPLLQTKSSHSAHFQEACKNKIFNAIAKRDEINLKQILHLINQGLAVTAEHRHSKRTPSAQAQNIQKNRPYSAEQLVLDFFNQTGSQALQELISYSQHNYFVLLLQACSAHTRYQLAQSNVTHPIIIHLPLSELKKFVSTLISPFQIYRDHQALLHVIDALTIRAEKGSLSDRAEIKQLQNNLLTEGIKFHEQCKHRHVIARLQSTQTRLLQDKLALLDETEENSPIPSLTKYQEAPSLAKIIQKPLYQPKQSTTAQEKLPQVINSDYRYETEDINAILAARVNESFPSVYVLAAAQMNIGIPGNSVADLLTDFIEQQDMSFIIENKECSLLIPIQVGGHWVGLAVKILATSITSLTYFNSLEDRPTDELRMAAIQAQLKQAGLINNELKVKPAPKAMQQCDRTSCGVLMIENFFCFLKKKWWIKKDTQTVTPENTEHFRKLHLRLLQREQPIFYSSFQERQAKNKASVPDLAVQQKSHGILAAGVGLFQTPSKQEKYRPQKERTYSLIGNHS
jgi:hypothetical protein